MSSFSGQYWRHFIYQIWSKNFRLIYGLESELHVSLLESKFYYSEIYSISFFKIILFIDKLDVETRYSRDLAKFETYV